MTSSQRREGCELCAAEKLTRWYYEDERIWVADCVICWVPMVVLKEHGLGTPDDYQHMISTAKAIFGDDCWIDGHMRLIPDHRHFHVRGFRRRPPALQTEAEGEAVLR